MLKVSYKWFSEFIDKISNFDFEKALNNGLSKWGLLAFRSIAIETPVDTGTLRRGWRLNKGNMYVKLENRTKYGRFIHDGTKFIKANPFMERGFEKVKSRVKAMVFSEIRKQIFE